MVPIERAQIDRIYRPAARTAHPQEPMPRCDGGSDGGREQHRHARFLASVPGRDQAFGILKDLRPERPARASASLAAAAARSLSMRRLLKPMVGIRPQAGPLVKGRYILAVVHAPRASHLLCGRAQRCALLHCFVRNLISKSARALPAFGQL
jgi:hypothetical protein